MSKSIMRYLTFTLIFTCTLLMGGCSMMRAGYDRLDWITLVWADRYMDFTSEQKDLLRPQLKQLLVWHRQQELPAYLNLIETRLEPLLQKDDISPAEWLDIMEQLRLRYIALASRAADQAEPLRETLGPEQMAALKAAYEKSNVKFRKKHLDPPMSEIREKRAEDFVELLDDWLGSLSDTQMQAINRSYQQRTVDNTLWWEERLVRQQLVLKALQRKPEDKSPRLVDAFLSLLDPVSPKGQLYLQRTHRDTAELLSEVWRLSTPKQRQLARDKAISLKKDIKKLT